MDAERAAEEIKVIRQLMERPVRYSTQSGLAGIVAGVVALLGLAADWLVCGAFGLGSRTMAINLCVWAAVFLVAAGSVMGLTRLRELRRGMVFWTPVKRKILMTVLPCFVAGAGLTAAIAWRYMNGVGPNEWGLIPPIWMSFYGVACWQVGECSIRELRGLGGAFILAAIVAAASFQYRIPGLTENNAAYVTLGVTFGGFHLAYGAIVWMRYGG